MPGRDGTGPEGKGPLTGRGLGPCNQDGQPQPRPGRGRAMRRGRGRP